MKKFAIALAMGALVAALALVGCSGGDQGGAAPEGDGAAGMTMTEGVLVVATSPDYPPFESLDGDAVVGFEADLWNAVAEELGMTAEVKVLQFDAIIPAIVSGGQADVGVSGFSILPERAKEINFTTSYYIDDQAIAVAAGSPVTSENVDTALNDASIVIACQSGTTGEAHALENFPNATVKGYGTSNDAFAAMQAGQADAVITNAAVVANMLEAYSDCVVVKQIATGEEYAMVVSKDNPALLEAINGALATLTENGTIDNLIAKWL